MPELPEVEYAARQLRAWMLERRVARAWVERSNVLRGRSPSHFAQALRDRRLEAVDRRGKYLLLTFDQDAGLLMHLGMTGKLLRRAVGEPVAYSRARFELDEGQAVHLRDPRKFGRVMICRAADLMRLPEIAALGPDALQAPPTAQSLAERLRRTRRPVKLALMDQRVIGGLGNIHVAEALFRAGISPKRRADLLKPDELARLADGIRDSIAFALQETPPIEAGVIEYVEEGGGNPFLVYGRAGEACRRCGAGLRSFVQGGRTTWFCPKCQR